MKKRLSAIFLSLCLLMTMLPTVAFAVDDAEDSNKIEAGNTEVQSTPDDAEESGSQKEPAETPTGTVISEDTTWNEAVTLTDNLTVNEGVTLTIGALVTVSGDVTISGGGTIKRADDYVGDIDKYTEPSTDKEGTLLETAPKTAHLFYVDEDSSLTVGNICIDGNAGWNLSDAAPVIEYGESTHVTTPKDYSDYNPVIGALINNAGELTLNNGAVLQNNFNFYEVDRSAAGLGGAVYNAGNMTVNDGAVIQYNSSRYGGAIRNEDGSYLHIAGGNIQYNNGSCGAAGIMANADMVFKMTGGVINANTSEVNSGWPVGSGIFFGDGVKATLTGGSITNNVGYSGGAGIFIRQDAVSVYVGEVTISNNRSLNSVEPAKSMGVGGGIYALGGEVTISGAKISGNTANSRGGGVFIEGCTVDITGDTVISNNKGGNGGGIYLNNAVCNISGNTRIDNNTIEDSQWSQTWTKGAGIYVARNAAQNEDSTLNISGNVKITNNNANGEQYARYGGGIYTQATVVIDGSNVVISGNKAICGGGIYAEGDSDTTITGSVNFANNIAENPNGDSRGGGIAVVNKSSAVLSGKNVIFEGNVTQAHGVSANNYSYSSYGGGIQFQGKNLTLKDITVKGGTLPDGVTANATNGGGIAIVKSGDTDVVQLENVTVSGNTASLHGGGIHLNADATITGGLLTENTSVDGGGIFTASSCTKCDMKDTKILENTATTGDSWLGGGGIYTDAKTIFSVVDCTIEKNTATTKDAAGGGIQNRGTLKIQNSVIKSNTAAHHGGGIDMFTGTISLSGTPVISGNTAKGKESNLYLTDRTNQQGIRYISLVTLSEALKSGAAIGVTTQTNATNGHPIQITAAETNTEYYKDAARYFIPDAAKVIAQANENGKYVELAYTNETYRKVTLNLTHASATGGLITQVKDGNRYSAAVTADTGYTMPATLADVNTYDRTADNRTANIGINSVTADKTIEIAAVPNQYTVAFDGNGSTSGSMNEQTMTYDESAALTANQYKKTGYNFVGWSTTANGSCEYPDQASVKNMTTENGATIKLYAVWSEKESLPAFDSSDNAIQSHKYDGSAKEYKLTSDIQGFVIAYQQNGEAVENPTNVGSYDVVISRAEDDTYAAFSQTITGGLVITAADYPVTVTADKTAMTGAGSVKLTASSSVESITVTGITCSDESVTVTKNDDGTYSAELPDTTKTYTFTAQVTGDLSNYGEGPATCTVSVTRRSSGGSHTSSNSSSTSYGISAPSVDNGKVSVSPSTAKKGDTVTITVTPNTGYKLDKLSVTDAKGNTLTVSDKGNGKYTFTMPDSKVTVTPTFVQETTQPEQPDKTRFVDVADNAWYAESVYYAADKGMMTGVGENKFAPTATTTRGMLMTILARYAGQDTSGSNPWYQKGMEWAKAKGVSDGTNPTGNITREQLVTMLYRYAGSPAASGSLNGFTDAASVSSYATNAMQWATANGIVNGANNQLNPKGNATRAEMAAILMRFSEKNK